VKKNHKNTAQCEATKTPNDASGQALWREIQRLRLTDDYKSNGDIGHWLHLFYGLPFLQPAVI